MKTVIIGLGNELVADDAIGVLAARALRGTIDPSVEIVETSMHGLALLDFFLGHERAILLDCIQTGQHPPGTIVEIDPDSLAPAYASSPHFSGLPEMIAIAKRMELEFPTQFKIFAVEVVDTQTLGGEMTPAVRAAIPEVCERVRTALAQWPMNESEGKQP